MTPREGGVTQRWTSPELTVAGDVLPAWVATTLAGWVPAAMTAMTAAGWAPAATTAGDRTGLYVSTADAGSREALAFWRAAHETGIAFAAPAAFPWTLANSPTGRISQALGITGPCTTFVGGAEAAAEADLAGRLDLADGIVTAALIVDIRGEAPPDAAGSPVRVLLAATVLGPRDVPG